MSVEFTDNTMSVKNALKNNILAFAHEAGGELRSQTQQNSRVDTGQTKGSYEYDVVEETNLITIYVGSPLENAVWEEFGTGEYALNGDGRKGYWVFVKGSDGSSTSKSSKSYSLEEAKKVMAILRSQGLDAYYTKGKKPNRPLYNAFIRLKDPLIELLKNKLNV